MRRGLMKIRLIEHKCYWFSTSIAKTDLNIFNPYIFKIPKLFSQLCKNITGVVNVYNLSERFLFLNHTVHVQLSMGCMILAKPFYRTLPADQVDISPQCKLYCTLWPYRHRLYLTTADHWWHICFVVHVPILILCFYRLIYILFYPWFAHSLLSSLSSLLQVT